MHCLQLHEVGEVPERPGVDVPQLVAIEQSTKREREEEGEEGGRRGEGKREGREEEGRRREGRKEGREGT